MQLYRHAVSSWIGLGKLSTLPSVSDLGREEGGDCGGEKKERDRQTERHTEESFREARALRNHHSFHFVPLLPPSSSLFVAISRSS